MKGAPLPWKLVAQYTPSYIPLARTIDTGHNELQRRGRLLQAARAQPELTSTVSERRGGRQLHAGRGCIHLAPVLRTVSGTQWIRTRYTLNERTCGCGGAWGSTTRQALHKTAVETPKERGVRRRRTQAAAAQRCTLWCSVAIKDIAMSIRQTRVRVGSTAY